MASPDYINWPTHGPWFNRDFLGGAVTVAFCANPNWRMSGELWEEIGPGAQGQATLIGEPTWMARGLRFNQPVLPQYANFTTCPAVEPNLANFSLVAHIFPITWPNDYTNIVDKRNAGLPYTGWMLGRFNWAGNDIAVEINGALRKGYVWASGLPIFSTTGAWETVIVTLDRSANATPYCNGVKGTAVNISGAAAQAAVGTNFLKIAGHHTDDHAFHFDGIFASFLYVNRVLTESEVSRISADPLAPFRRREIAYFFGSAAAPPAGAPRFKVGRTLAGRSRVLGGLAA